MKNKLLTSALVAGTLFSNAIIQAQTTTLYGITNANTIFTISNVNSPSTISGPYTISGITSGQALVGLDARPGTGALYALGYDSLANTARLYVITNSGTSYTANAVGSLMSSINIGGTGNAAVDFVSTADNEIRIVGRNGNNYLINANNGTVISTGGSSMSYATGDIHSIGSNALAATAYTNSFYGADATTEVGYDMVNNTLISFDAGSYSNSFNNTSNTMHSIGIGTGTTFTGNLFGMDTWYDTLAHNNTIYMTGSTLLGTHLYSYDMSGTTGTLTDLGMVGGGTMQVRDIAFGTVRDSVSAVTQLMTGLSLNLRNLVFFDAMNPSNIRRIVSLNGMTSAQSMIGIDYSMMTGILYGLGYNSTAQTYQLYTIDTATGHVTAVNSTPHNLALGTDNGSGNSINVAFRFIPTAMDMIRVIGNNGNTNVQIDANTGAVTSTDNNLTYITGDANFGANVNLTSAAYTGYTNDGSTQMFGFDANTGSMIMFNTSNSSIGMGDGTSGYINTSISLNTVFSLLLHTNTYNNAYMSIIYDQATALNMGYMVANYYGDSSIQGNYSILYDMSSMLGGYHKGTSTAPSAIGRVGSATPFKDVVARRRGFTPTGVTAINNVTAGTLVYPNPATSNTHILLHSLPASNVYVDIVDLNGSTLRKYEYAPGTYNLDVDLTNLPSGLYSVRVHGKDVAFQNLEVVKQ